jgi:hypothetical protein
MRRDDNRIRAAHGWWCCLLDGGKQTAQGRPGAEAAASASKTRAFELQAISECFSA